MIKIDDIERLARELINDRANEVKHRCAISRAYYATFHYCKNAATKWCNPLPESEKENKGEHSKLYLQLDTCSKDQAKAGNLRLMAAEARKLKNLRTRADYNLDETLDGKDYTRGMSYLSQVKTYLSELNNTEPTV